MQNYKELQDLPTAQTEEAKICLENASLTDILHLEQKSNVPARINSR